MRKRKFSNPQMARAYEAALANHDVLMTGSGVDRDYYQRGYNCVFGKDRRPQRDSLSYAIWAAGVDNRREHDRQIRKDQE